jgi:hypothetical protein
LCGCLVIALAGCASKPTPAPSAPPASDPCLLVSPPAERLDTFTIALLDPVDVSRPKQPGNESERLLFRNLLLNLVRLDCRGELRPGIVSSWSQDSSGSWTLTLQENARYQSGRPLPLTDIVSTLAPSAGANLPGMDSAAVLNQRQIRIFLTGSPDSVLRTLADPAFAILDDVPSRNGSTSEGPVELFEIPAQGAHPVVRFQLHPGDGRDALDRGADLIVTRSTTLLEYAARRPEFTLHPLPWDETYVLAQPAGAQSLAAAGTDAERQSLARDAVSAEARAAEPPFWWEESSCRPGKAPEASPTSDRIVYRRDDAVARALAERLVALAGSGHRLRAAALEQSELAAALRSGSERAYVLGLPRTPLQPCRESSNFPAGTRIQPLIDSRAHAIVRLGAPPLSVDWDGTVRLVRP